jgi:hypothetical protein
MKIERGRRWNCHLLVRLAHTEWSITIRFLLRVFVSCLSVRVHTFVPQAALGECERPPPKRLKAASTHPHIRNCCRETHDVHCICNQNKKIYMNLSCAYPLIITEYIIQIGSDHYVVVYYYIVRPPVYWLHFNVYLYIAPVRDLLIISLSLSAPSHILYYLQPSAYLSFSISH